MAVITTPPKESPTKSPARRRSGRRLQRSHVLNVASLVIGIAVWAAVSSIEAIGLPGPLAVVTRAGEMIADGTLTSDMAASLRRVFTGFALGTALAVPIGFLMGWYPTMRALLEPYVQFFRMVPPLAIIPLAIVLLGIGEVPKIFVIFLAAFLFSVVATLQGVVNVEPTLINAARVLGAPDRTIFMKVIIPASAPFILVGMRTGLGAAWATLVAAELIAAQAGLGYRMQQAQLYYDLPTIFVGLITIGVLGMAMDRLLLLAEKRLTGWQERR